MRTNDERAGWSVGRAARAGLVAAAILTSAVGTASAASLAATQTVNAGCGKSFTGPTADQLYALGMSVGLGVAGSRNAVASARLSDGTDPVVRVDDKPDVVLGLLMEAHVVTSKSDARFKNGPGIVAYLGSSGLTGVGPAWVFVTESDAVKTAASAAQTQACARDFVAKNPQPAANLTDDKKELRAAASEVLADPPATKPTIKSQNFGIGVVFFNNVKRLADGTVANQPLPSSETTIHYKTTHDWGPVFFYSVGF